MLIEPMLDRVTLIKKLEKPIEFKVKTKAEITLPSLPWPNHPYVSHYG